MTLRQWMFVILFAVLLTCSLSRVQEAVPIPSVDAAASAQNQPVVAPVPNGVDPSSPSVSGEPPDDVQTSTPIAAPTAGNTSNY